MDAARKAVKVFVLNDGKSYRTIKSDKTRFVIACKDATCKFRIRACRSKKEVVSITIFEAHSCSPATHYKSWHSQSLQHLIEHYRATIIDNRNVTAAQIRSNERLQFSNDISYKQAHCTIKAILAEIDGNEADCFAKFPTFRERYKAVDSKNYCQLAIANSGHFETAFFAPAELRYGHWYLRPFVGFNSAYTKSRF